jgi:hypothetical protein
MTSDEQTFFEWVGAGAATAFSTILWWIWDKLVKKVEKSDDKIAAIDKALDDHRVYSADQYVKKDAIDRIHTRIDGIGKDVSDIKTMLISTLSGKHP